jgi:selenide, water dikinase
VSPEQTDRRRSVMQRSVAIGHCVCRPRVPCPCDLFREHSVCECAGETLPRPEGSVRLTELVRSAGCASKIGKKDLLQALRGLPQLEDPRVIIGRDAGDDAGVILLSDREATVLTTDVLTPPVDDPYVFGQIAAANSVSDVYAMGATPQCALSIIGFPRRHLPVDVMKEVLRGGFEKMKEAGVSVLGGHSIDDDEMKFGFAVLGTCPRDALISNSGAMAGDVMVLTKPLGTGIVSFAGQCKRASEESLRQAACSMVALNRIAGQSMVTHHAHAATDITGFGLLSHMAEVARSSGVELQVDFDAIALLPEVRQLALWQVLPGALERNREALPDCMLDLRSLSAAQQALLFCPETSGGLLICLPEPDAFALVHQLHSEGVAQASVIGRVAGRHDAGMIRVTSSLRWEAGSDQLPQRSGPRPESPEPRDPAAQCCTPGGDSQPARASTSARPESQGVDPSAAFWGYMKGVTSPGALDGRTKRLIALALSVATRCEPCIGKNRQAALDLGASEQQVAESIELGIAFGGASSAMFFDKLGSERPEDR